MSPFGFDIRQISGSPWATLSLSMDTLREDARLKASYWCPMTSWGSDYSIFPPMTMRDTSLDYLLDLRYAYMKTAYNVQNEPWKFMPMMGYSGGYTGVGSTGAGGWQFPQFPIQMPGMQPPHQETEEEKAKREAKEKDAKSPEALKATKMQEFFNKFKTLSEVSSNGLPDVKTLVPQVEEAMKKETASERLEAMQRVINQIPQKYLLKAIYANDDVKIKLIDSGFNYQSLVFNDQNLFPKTDSNGQLDWRNTENITTLHNSLQSKTNDTNLRSCGLSTRKDQVLTVISKWNDQYSTSTEKGIMAYIAKNLPTISGSESDKDLAKNYVVGIEGLSKALIDKAADWVSEGSGKYPKLNADKTALETAVAKITADSPNNLTQANMNDLADKFNKLYARLRLMEAERINQHILSTYSDYKDLGTDGNLLNDETVIKETKEDLIAEKLDIPTDLDIIEKPDSLILQERVPIDNIGNVTKDNIETLTAAGTLEAVNGKENWYESHKLYIQPDGTLLTKEEYDGLSDEEKKDVQITKKYYVMSDGKLVETKKDENGNLVPDDTKPVKSSEIQDINSSLDNVRRLKNEGKVNILTNLEGVKVPEGVILLQSAINENNAIPRYYIWHNGQIRKIKDVTRVYIDNNQIKFVINNEADATKHLTFEQLLAKGDEAFELFVESELKTQADIDAKKAEAEEAKRKEEEEKAKAPITKVEQEQCDLGRRDITQEKLNELGIVETSVPGWYRSKTKVKNPGDKEEHYRYFKMELDKNDNKYHIKHQPDIVSIDNEGMCKTKDGKIKPIPQWGTPEEVSDLLRNALEGDTDDSEEIIAKRALNTFFAYEDTEQQIKFLERYREECGFFYNNLCKQIRSEYGCFKNKMMYKGKELFVNDVYNRKIAEKLLKLVNSIDPNLITDNQAEVLKDYIDVNNTNPDQVIDTDDHWFTKKIQIWNFLDDLTEKVINAYREKHPKDNAALSGLQLEA